MIKNFLLISVLLSLFIFTIIKITENKNIFNPQFSQSNIIFSAGSGGSSGNASVNGNPLSSGGGGGAGGLIVSYNISRFYSKEAGKGNDEGGNYGGYGGKGLGAGGGGAGCLVPYGGTIGGTGNHGFVYIFEDNMFIKSSTQYVVKSSSLSINIILMGGGGGGGGLLLSNPSEYVINTGGNGGCAGNILYARNINSVPGSTLNIQIGQGGTSGQNGGDTIVTNNVLNISLTAYGGFNGNNVSFSTVATNSIFINDQSSAGSAIGSKFSTFTGTVDSNGNILINGPGGMVKDNFIFHLNNF